MDYWTEQLQKDKDLVLNDNLLRMKISAFGLPHFALYGQNPSNPLYRGEKTQSMVKDSYSSGSLENTLAAPQNNRLLDVARIAAGGLASHAYTSLSNVSDRNTLGYQVNNVIQFPTKTQQDATYLRHAA